MKTFFKSIGNPIINNISFTSRIPKGRIMTPKTYTEDGFINDVITKIQGFETADEATSFLIDSAENGNFTIQEGVLFKHGDYTIQNLLKSYGLPYAENMKRLSKLKLSITPEHMKTIVKNNEVYIVSRIPGTSSGDLIPFNEAYQTIPREGLLAAYKDLQKVTKAGLVDDKILSSTKYWYVTPDDKRVVMPSWESTRQLHSNESKNVLGQFYSMLFRK